MQQGDGAHISETDRQIYAQWQEGVSAGQATPALDVMRHVLQRQLQRPICVNRGWVTDNLDYSSQDVRFLLKLGATSNEDPSQAAQNEAGSSDDGSSQRHITLQDILPHFVFSLEASDATLQSRIARNKGDSSSAQTRLQQFRANNNDESSSLDFFEENEIHAIVLPVSDSTQETELLEQVKNKVGKPRHFGPSEEEQAEIKKQAAIRKVLVLKLSCDQKAYKPGKRLRRRKSKRWCVHRTKRCNRNDMPPPSPNGYHSFLMKNCKEGSE